MKKFLYLLIFSTSFIFGQNQTFYYEMCSRTNNEKDFTSKQIFSLDISKSKSVFRSQAERTSDSLLSIGDISTMNYIDFNQLYCKKNLDIREIQKVVSMPLYNIIYEVSIEDLHWTLLDGTTNIAGFNCFKAETDYGGRKWIAWYTTEIPISDGPYVFRGLPGLITSIYDTQNEYQFKMLSSSKSQNDTLFKIKKGKTITWDSFKKIQQNFYSNPFAELVMSSSKMIVTDDKGNKLDRNYSDMTKKIQQNLRNNNNPIELNYKIDFN